MSALFTPGTEGVFPDLSFETYRAAPGIGQSMLKQFDAEPTPAHFLESLTRPKETTEAMEFGTILHCAILTPELLSKAYYVRPETYRANGMKCPTCESVTDAKTCKKCKCERVSVQVEKPWDGNATVCQEWKAEHADRPVITVETEAKIPFIVETVRGLPVVGDIIRTGQKEVSFFKRDEETGLLLKCRVDAISTAKDGTTFIVDPKKVRRAYATQERFGVQCVDKGYDIQAASYINITGASKFIFVPMEEAAPYDAEMFQLSETDMAEGFKKWRAILRSYAKCVVNESWPGYTRTVKVLTLPAWARSKERREAEVIYDV